ncbi:extracellular solute-binding protein [Saccharopolyspora gloriosae]|uniref:extracellular solute-binding protein n=1 Tax=Saccharopolyspora gloriosae TaxID=455344 RepID=UPI001FB82EF8|nr:extracellular solute-binding protein [Saccharopolyspora gloriosae]
MFPRSNEARSRAVAARCPVLALVVLVLAGALAGCGTEPRRLVYWASNQGASTAQDREILRAQLARFTRDTGIPVEVDVIPWNDLLNRILGAATSGTGPDVVDLGNTWSASLQATGAFVEFDEELLDRLGGRDRFLASSMSSAGMPGRPPASVPLYGLSYAVFYDKQRFREAGITRIPETWAEFLTVADRLTDGDRAGLTIPGASYTQNAHFAFLFGMQQGARFIDERGAAAFTSPQAVESVLRYVRLMSEQRVVRPDDAEVGSAPESVDDFTAGRAAMLIAQNSALPAIVDSGMPTEDVGVFPLPLPDPLPPGGSPARSHVGGSNVAVLRDGPRREQSLRLVEFLTSKRTQVELSRSYGSLPVVVDAYDDPEFSTGHAAVFGRLLAHESVPVPMIPDESRFETTVGGAVRDLFAGAALGERVGREQVRAELEQAQQQMRAAGGGG